MIFVVVVFVVFFFSVFLYLCILEDFICRSGSDISDDLFFIFG